MPSKPRFSILINNYNYGRYLGAAVHSACTQTYAPHEVIVVDDGSTDDSLQVLKKFPHVQVLAQSNSGQGVAIQNGIKAASGDVICLLDADDFWEAGKLEALTDCLPILPSDWTFLRHNLRVIRTSQQTELPVETPGIGRYATRSKLPAADVLAERWNAPTSAICAPRDALLEVTKRYPLHRFRISADAVLYTFLPQFGSSVSLAETLGFYRVHGRNAFFGKQSAEQAIAQVHLELDLLALAGADARYGDTVLEAAHCVDHLAPNYLEGLGGLPVRLRRIWGDSSSASTVSTRTRAVVRELLRTAK